MSHDVSAERAPAPAEEPRLRPTVSWPTTMTYNQRHLVSVDLALVNRDGTPAPWPLPEEDYTYTCLLDGGGVFNLWAVHDASVVLHRFGASYGPAQFVVIPVKKTPGRQLLWLTIINQWGVSVGDYELPVDVYVPQGQGDQGTVPDLTIPAGLSPADVADILAVGDELTVDIPHRDLPDVPGDSPDAGRDNEPPTVQQAEPAPPGPTVTDPPYQGEDDRETGEPVAATRRDLDVEPHAEPSVPPRRDSARLTVRLPEYYNVAGLRRSRSGRLHWDMVPLFSPGSTRGDRATFTACCSPSDERGTVFAVFGQPENGSGRGPEMRSVQSAKIPPGMYQVIAELTEPGTGPGRFHGVQFHGLPVQPREDPRPWQEIAATVPRTLPAGGGPAHLIVAIEISAPDDLIVAERLDAVRRLILHVAAEARDFVCYSVITYGPHSIHFGNRDYPDVPVTMVAWAVTGDDALAELDRLSRRGLAPFGYERAAQLECLLTDLNDVLTGQEGRPVIVTAGARPPHPPRVDPESGIIPCPRRNDWTVPMERLLARYPGIKFGSIRDAGRVDRLWRMLGTDATTVDDYFAPGFARSLGLTSAAARPSAPPIAVPLFNA